MLIDAIIVAAGQGERLGSSLPKQFLQIHNKPLFTYSLQALLSLNIFRRMVIVTQPPFNSLVKEAIEPFILSYGTDIQIVDGGSKRQDSVRLGVFSLEKFDRAPNRICIHDACRPVLSTPFLSRIKETIQNRSFSAWIPIVSETDTLKKIHEGQVECTLSREEVFKAQTPQIFEYPILKSLLSQAHMENQTFTDEAGLFEHYQIPVGTFSGDPQNLKLTYPYEIDLIKVLLEKKEWTCDLESVQISTV